jgi:hypothetical protein
MSEVSTWNAVDASNNATPPDGFPEGMQPSAVNDAARMMMGALRREHDNIVAQIGSVAGTISTTTINATTINTTGAITASGPITGSAINSTGNASVAGTLTAGAVSSSGTIQAGQLTSTGNASVAGTLTAAQLTSTGNANVAGTMTAASVQSSGDVGAAGSFFANGNMSAGGTIQASYIHSTGNIDADGTVHAAGTQMFMGNGGAGRILQMGSGWFWEWNSSNGDLVWGGPSGAQFWVTRYSDHYCGNQIGPVFGFGAYINASDVRGKTDIAPARQGLDEILKLSPITFKRAGQDRVELGFGAQDVQGILPEAVHPMDAGADPSLGVSLDPIVAALVNAVKELTQQVEALKQEKTHV